jgi:hypothetical protein
VVRDDKADAPGVERVAAEAMVCRATEKKMAPMILCSPRRARNTPPAMEIRIPALMPLQIFFSIVLFFPFGDDLPIQ